MTRRNVTRRGFLALAGSTVLLAACGGAAPTSTLHNWQKECARFLPAFRVLPYWGPERHLLRKGWQKQRGPGGKRIIGLASSTDDGAVSRIKPLLGAGDGVGIARSDAHYVVTEWGIAHLFGKSIRERAVALIDIARPAHREALLVEAKRLGYVPKEQCLASQAGYPVQEERAVCLKNGARVLIRPARAADAAGLQALFHRMTPDDRYTRFASTRRSWAAPATSSTRRRAWPRSPSWWRPSGRAAGSARRCGGACRSTPARGACAASPPRSWRATRAWCAWRTVRGAASPRPQRRARRT